MITHRQTSYHRRMLGKLRCKCHRCVARRRLIFTFATALFALVPIGYLALPDHRQSAKVTISSTPRESPSEPTKNGPESIAPAPESSPALVLAKTPLGSIEATTPTGSLTPQAKQAVVPVPSLEANSADPAADFSTIAAEPATGNSEKGPVSVASPRLEKEALANHAPSSTPEQAVVPVPSPAANSEGPANSSTIAAASATGNSLNRPVYVSPIQLEREAFADYAPLTSRVAPHPVAIGTPTPMVTPGAETLPSPNIATTTPAVQQDSSPRGYITVESRIAAPRTSPGTGHVQKPAQPWPDVQQTPPAPRESFAKAADVPAEGRGTPEKVGQRPSGELQRFALDFVQTDKARNVASERRFYADSVHFFNEGNLSWSGVAAATRRYHNKQNKQFQVAGTPVVKGPVNGGFYVIEQPVSWSQKEGSVLLRGRSILRLQVLATGRAGWKITSIEEVGR
jgi:hypothetical protein